MPTIIPISVIIKLQKIEETLYLMFGQLYSTPNLTRNRLIPNTH